MRRFRNSLRARDRVRRCAVGAAFFGCAMAAHASDPALAPLGLNEVAELAVQQQPLLTGLDAQARAAREAAVSSAQLPDPQLFGGVRDLPVESHDAYSLSDDSDTQLVVGVSQEFPRAAKRRLRAEQREREADRLHDERRLTALSVRRDASLAWLDCWRAESARQIAADTLGCSATAGAGRRDRRAVGFRNAIRLRFGAAERRTDARRRGGARSGIGRGALQARALGRRRSAPTGVRSHPSSRRCRPRQRCWNAFHRIRNSPCCASASTSRGPTSISPKRNGSPDWRVEFGYGYRRDYSDMVMLQVGMDLPVFSGNRQDRDIASALAMGEAAAAQLEDGERRLESRALEAARDIERIGQRLAAYDRDIEPQTSLGIEAATAAWRSGNGTLGQVLDAQRIRLDVLLARLDLLFDATKRRIELDYLMGGE